MLEEYIERGKNLKALGLNTLYASTQTQALRCETAANHKGRYISANCLLC